MYEQNVIEQNLAHLSSQDISLNNSVIFHKLAKMWTNTHLLQYV